MADERDACALVSIVRKDGRSTGAVAELARQGLVALAHRSGSVDGEGDGSGLLTDIPRALWADELAASGVDPGLVERPEFAVAHLFVPREGDEYTAQATRQILGAHGARIHHERHGTTRSAALGSRGRAGEPRFWQLALSVDADPVVTDRALWRAAAAIEAETSATVVSLSRSTAVYKLRGDATQLALYFTDLADPRFTTSMAFGHNRYSTNTTTTFERVQPFLSFAHNGEIDTIGRLRDEALALRLPLSRDGSDSQDVDAVLRGMTAGLELDPIEAIELLFPPIVNELRRLRPELQDAYVQSRAAFGPFAQGPAAFLARVGDLCLFGVDAMGLRPLWHVETDEVHVFASERGFIPLADYATDPRPLGPGERVALERRRQGWVLIDQEGLRERFLSARQARGAAVTGRRERLATGGPETVTADGIPSTRLEIGSPPDEVEDLVVRREQQFAALGYEPDDLKAAAYMETTANELIGSLGYDGPLAALSGRRTNLADHLQETVAVVTNPAIDREREIEHFSTRAIIGARPALERSDERRWIELRMPILLGGHAAEARVAPEMERPIARSLGTWLLEDLIAELAPEGATGLSADRDWDEPAHDALARLGADACRAVRAGAPVVVIGDRGVSAEGRAWLDPHLVTAAVHGALLAQPGSTGSLRRDAAVIVSAGSFRNLHDIVVALGLGADAVAPYLLLEHAIASGDPDALPNLVEALRKGIEKVISTLGIHELRGYGRAFSAIGVAPDVAKLLGVRTFAASGAAGLDWREIERDGLERAAMLRDRTPARLEPAFRIYPRVWKAALAVANGESTYAAYAERLGELEREHPVSLRHLVDIVSPGDGSAGDGPDGGEASTRTGEHAAPFYISSMSFGSQGETAYRAYAEAAAQLDILCINGEGGELPDLLGRYPRHRGQQIASGRFGVSALLANSSNYLEIKIGQGAKPGEGGHLPGRKVSAKVALARNAEIGVDLISPSNNHDIYSIEDLAQVVHELKTVNPRAKIAVKVPVVPDIGIIASGIAKAGADIVTLSGYDGGTGAARQHALRRAGLPVEIGVVEAHRALVANGLRDRVELWCDGGMKSAADVVKMLCLGADRVGFGTLAMVAIGCTICRGCQLDTCHVGIATQIDSLAEASARGLKRFVPQEQDRAVENLRRFFGALREALATQVAALGVASVRDLVGRADLLVQARGVDRVDLAMLLTPVAVGVAAQPLQVAIAASAAIKGGRSLSSADRFVGTGAAGALARSRIFAAAPPAPAAAFGGGSVAGNGFAAYATEGLDLAIGGGVQDGAAKTALGGTAAILKAPNAVGRFVDGAVGKSFAYGAQRGRFFVQGGADARAAIRLSGAEVVFGGDLGGFAFEYMTAGTAIVLGDPGRWICSGMSGGIVFVRRDPGRGIDEAGLRERLAKGAKVNIGLPPTEGPARAKLDELLAGYARLLTGSGQEDEARMVRQLIRHAERAFLAIRPGGEQVDQTVTTE
ncbi:MAG: glutamate synthase-related protein [Candidatus Limnocylindrales bacterium]